MEPTPAVVAVAAPVGGLKALTTVLSTLPPDFPAAVLVVRHITREARFLLGDILNLVTPLPNKEAEPREVLCTSTVYFAPPEHGLFVNAGGTLSPVLPTCPSAELHFASVAATFRGRATAVVLAGDGRGGCEWVRLVKQGGGTVIAQDEDFGMPVAAMATGCVDAVLPLQRIGPALMALTGGGLREEHRREKAVPR